VYGREAILLIDETKYLMIYDRMMSIIKEISYIREEARLMIQKAQDYMMQQTPEKEKRFIVSEKILCHNLAKKS